MFPSEKKEILEIFKNLKVLIIDEDEFIFNLKKFIPNLYICISPNQTLELIKNNNFDLLVINYWMSHINGFELVNFFKKRNPDAGIILLTSEDKPLSKEIINIGIDKYILKTNYEETNKELLKAIEEMSERKFLKASLLKRREAELKSFQVFHKYLRYQQEKGLKKQKNIIKDDLAFSTYLNKIPFTQKFFYFQTFYKPLEIISGDIYSLRIIKNNKIFLFLMDVKEKGIPASITASSTTTFLNYLIDILLRIKIKESLYTYKDYFKFLIKEFLEYIKTYLLEDEALCILFLLMDLKNNKVLIANFGIPSIYIIKDSNLKRIPPQNLPILTSTETFKIDSLALLDIDKIIIASDGILSCKMKNSKLYIEDFEKDLLKSSYLNEWRNLFEKKVERISDDITLIYINSCKIDGFFKKEFKIKSDLAEINKFLSQVYRRLKKSEYFNFLAPKIVTILNEILLNAHEHGTLGVSSLEKEKKIIEGSYENFLQQQQQQQIIIKFVLSLSKKELYIIVEDKGKGFKKSLIENTLERTFSGFGLKIIKHLCKDFFFNKKGNTIVVIVDIKRR